MKPDLTIKWPEMPPSNRPGMTRSELAVWTKLIEVHGNIVVRNGWPDFFVWNSKRALPFAVEVKHGDDKISPKQSQMHTLLKQSGIPVYIVNNGWCDELKLRFYDELSL